MTNVPLDITPNVPPLGPLGGDYGDDDGRALDEAFEAMDAGPQQYGGVPADREDLPVTTRIINNRYTLPDPIDVNANQFSGVMILPADPNRTKLQVTIKGGALFEAMVSDRNDFNGNSARLVGGSTIVLSLDGHTGPLWAAACSAGGASLHVWAVTS